jgi:hypothetical protein
MSKLKMLRNKIYLFDKRLNDLVALLAIGSSVAMLAFEATMFAGIAIMSISCLYVVFVKARINTGEFELDKSLYELPAIGETITIQRKFKYDISKVSNRGNYIYEKSIIAFEKGLEFEVAEVIEIKDDWILRLKGADWNAEVFYLDVKSRVMTKSDEREEKLKRILEK